MGWTRAHRLANVVVQSPLYPVRLRVRTLRLLGVRAERSVLRERVTIAGPDLTIGHGVFVNAGTSLLNQAGIVLGDDVAIGPDAVLLTSGHEIGGARRRQGAVVRRRIVVGDGTWIGARAVVLPGVTIGAGCVIAAGAVVTRDCPPNGLYAGVPARRMRELPT
jgi:maltose O-acetyltransferase